MIADINKDVASSKLIIFADDTRLGYIIKFLTLHEDCDSLQQELNSVYKWASENNMFFNAKKSTIYLLVPPKLQTKVISTLNPQ